MIDASTIDIKISHSVSDGYIPAVDHLYFHSEYLKTQSYETLSIFELYVDQLPVGTMIFTVTDEEAISISRAPYGSMITQKPVTSNAINYFLERVIAELQREKVRRINIVLAPALYENFAELSAYKRVGFEENFVDCNQYIALGEELELHNMERRKFRTALNSGIACQLLPNSMWESIYDFIADCRTEKDLTINITKEKFHQLLTVLPKRYLLFGAFRKSELLAACVVGLVTNDIAYYYLPATRSSASKLSPMVPLLIFMNDFLKRKGFRYFDLGVSSVRGEKQEGLYDFKKRMGAKEQRKYTIKMTL